MKTRVLLLSLLLLGLVATAFAHHAFSPYFDTNNPVSVTGTIVRVDWANPAVYVHLRVEDKATGKSTTWAFEAESFRYLESAFKLSKDMFKVDSTITIVGYGKRPGGLDVADTITNNPELAALVRVETQAAIAQFEFADGKKVAIMNTVPEIPKK
jgi:hypothetical protein